MKVPKIIHQTWKTEKVPEELNFCVESWKKLNPDWQYILWTHKKMALFVKDNFPDIYKTYKNYGNDIFRADLFRLLVLIKMGGVYVDLDMECVKSLDTLFDKFMGNANLSVCKRPEIFAKMYKVPIYIQNYFIASTPENKILLKIVEDILNKGTEHDVKRVVHATGPLAFTESLNKMSIEKLIRNNDIKVLDDKIIGSLVNITWGKMYSSPTLRKMVLETIKMLLTRKFYPETCMVHYFHGTYGKQKPMLSLTREELMKKYEDLRGISKINTAKKNILSKIDRLVGLAGLFIKKINPGFYEFLKNKT